MTSIRQLLDERMADRPDDVDLIEPDAPALRRDPSETALLTDQWLKRRGRELCEQEWAQGMFEADELTDCFAACFNALPMLVEECKDALRHEWFKDLLESSAHAALHSATQLSDAMAEIGAGVVARNWARYRNTYRDETDSDLLRFRSASKAAEDAMDEIETAKVMASAMGLGGNGPADNGGIDGPAMVAAYDRFKNNSRLRSIIELAGRYQNIARSQQRRKNEHGVDDAVGIVLDGDLARMTTNEALMLAEPETELDLLRRLQERQVMCRQYGGVSPVGKGPIVVVVDESGSMEGEPIANAKALALAMGWVARHQNRWIAFVGFAGGSQGTRLAMPPGQWDQQKLYDWLEHFYDGGTSLDVPIHELPFCYWPEFIDQGMPRGKTDVLLVTDAVVECPDYMRDRWNKWRAEENVRSYGIVIGSRIGGLEHIVDRAWSVDCLDGTSEAVIESLSV